MPSRQRQQQLTPEGKRELVVLPRSEPAIVSKNQGGASWQGTGPAIVCLAAATFVVGSLPSMFGRPIHDLRSVSRHSSAPPAAIKAEWCELVDAQGRIRRLQLCGTPSTEEIVSPTGTACGESLPWNAWRAYSVGIVRAR